MVTPEVLEYIKKKSAAGASPEAIRTELANTGWQPADIDDAMGQAGLAPTIPPATQRPPATEQAPPVQTPPQATPAMAQAPAESTSPATTQQPSSQIPGYVDENKKKGGKGVLAIVVILLLLIGGGAAYGAYWYIGNNPDPMKVFADGFDRSSQVTSAHIDGDFGLDMDITMDVDLGDTVDEVTGGFGYGLDFSGVYDISDPQNIQLDGTAALDFDGAMEGMSISWGATIDMKMIANSIYLRLRDTEPLMFFDFTPFEDEWILIDIDSLAAEAGLTDEELAMLNPAQTAELQEKMMKRLVAEFSDQNTRQLFEEGITLVGVEDVGGVSTYHVSLQYPKETWKLILEKYFTVVFEIMSDEEFLGSMPQVAGAPMDMEAEMTAALDEMQEMLDDPEFETVLEILAEMKADVWVGKKDSYIRKAHLGILVKDKTVTVEEESAEIDVDFNYTIDITRINEPVSVDRPTNVTAIETFMEDAMGGLYGDMMMETDYMQASGSPYMSDVEMVEMDPEAQAEFDLQQKKANALDDLLNIRVNAELYYDDNDFSYGAGTVGNCSSYVGVEGDNFLEASEPIAMGIVDMQDAGVEVTCVIAANGKSHAVALKFLDGEIMCIDSMGYYGPAVKITENKELDAIVCQE